VKDEREEEERARARGKDAKEIELCQFDQVDFTASLRGVSQKGSIEDSHVNRFYSKRVAAFPHR
jgi:hypothetical protein